MFRLVTKFASRLVGIHYYLPFIRAISSTPVGLRV